MKKIFIFIYSLCSLANVLAQDNIAYQKPSAELQQLLDAPATPAIVFSPDKKWMAQLDRSDYPTIEELSRPEMRLGGLRFDPANFGPSRQRYLIGVLLKNLQDKKEYTVQGLPSPLLMSNPSFSPDSKKMAFLQNYADRIELWVVDLTTFKAEKQSEKKINSILTGGYSWFSDSKRLLLTIVPEKQISKPEKSRVPNGPVIEENLGRKAPSRTFQDLLKNPYDEQMFEYYTTTQLAVKTIGGSENAITSPAVYTTASTSPDGNHILIRELHKPFSYLVPFNRFPQYVKVLQSDGTLVKQLADLPLQDNIPNGFNAVPTGPRNHSWRSDVAATIFWVEAQDGGDPKNKAEVRDIVFEQNVPFNQAASKLIDLPLRYSGITWGNSTVAWVYENWWTDRKIRTYQLNPTTKAKEVIEDRSSEDAYNDPGNVLTELNTFGRSVMMVRNNTVWLSGLGSSPEGDRPFLDTYHLTSKKKTRLWRSEAPYFESVVTVLDAKKNTFVTSRESLTENPNFYIRTAGAKNISQLTNFPHPYPLLKNVKKQVLQYKRADGVNLTADLYVPADYKKEDGPLPTFLWAYPEEFKSNANAGQVKGSPYTFPRIGWGSAIYWVAKGYAILDNASIPIVGEGDKEPNDTYIEQLVASAKAAIDYGASLGVVDPKRVAAGGHSYGAFMTGNLLAHSDLFKAGIARSGAYNRTLTPFGFQSEERTYWEAPKVYFDMSPFSFADKIKEPILLIHGEADNNPGTFPIQSERFYNALKGHGATARYVVLPYESHGYQAKENLLHMLWEMDQWLEKYVKNAK
ncbi:MAG: prolyl oligopeptidase family serine peptidase [Chryseotalea sp.]|jgi:dipeptidyl aminopeptidase/acylaminoacyl peptidase|nr:prolyl oligopeptidase family serine peptidase [Cytophagales bacterium]